MVICIQYAYVYVPLYTRTHLYMRLFVCNYTYAQRNRQTRSHYICLYAMFIRMFSTLMRVYKYIFEYSHAYEPEIMLLPPKANVLQLSQIIK